MCRKEEELSTVSHLHLTAIFPRVSETRDEDVPLDERVWSVSPAVCPLALYSAPRMCHTLADKACFCSESSTRTTNFVFSVV